LDAIREQIIPCWNFDAGVEHPERYTVRLHVMFAPDGSVSHVEVEDAERVKQDAAFASVVESARRAVLDPSCQPIKFPPGHYIPAATIVFDLEKAINGGY
jgi:hypothetical protein